MTIMKYSIATVLISVPALAQTNGMYLLTSSNTVSPSSPTTTIEIWAAWSAPRDEHVFGGGNYDIVAGEGIFSNPINMLNGPGSSAGIPAGNVVTGGINGRVWCEFCGPPPLANPVLLATYDWDTTDFTPRTVELVTSSTSSFIVLNWFSRQTVQLFPSEFTPGSGVINVVPTPAAWFALVLPLVAGRRRRRWRGVCSSTRVHPRAHVDTC